VNTRRGEPVGYCRGGDDTTLTWMGVQSVSRAVRGLQCPSHTGPPQRHCQRGPPVWLSIPFLREATSVNATKIVGVDKCRKNRAGQGKTGHSATKRTAVVGHLRGSRQVFSEPCCNHHDKRARQGAYNFTFMQRIITRRMSSPLLFHNRQIIMATGGSFDKPVERAIRGKVSSNWPHRYPAPDPLVVSAH
jgi:hypothetical protein